MRTQLFQIPDGNAGLDTIIRILNELAAIYGQSPVIRRKALSLLNDLGQDDQLKQCQLLTAFVRDNLTYVNDPVAVEDITSPVQLLKQFETTGQMMGDCDDHCLMLSALLQSIGRDCVIAGVKMDGPEFNHVIVLALVNGQEYSLDPCAKFSAAPVYTEFLLP